MVTAPDRKPLHRRRVHRLAWTVLAVLGVEALVRIAGPSLAAWDPRSFATKLETFRRQPEPDLVLLGSSRAAYALSPAEFEAGLGRRSFNLAFPATKAFDWRILCRDVLADRPPRLALLGVNASEVRSDFAPNEYVGERFGLGDLVAYSRREGIEPEVIGNFARARLSGLWALYDQRYPLRVWCDDLLGRCHGGYGAEARRVRARNGLRFAPDGYDHPWLAGQMLRTLTQRAGDDPERFAADVPQFSDTGLNFEAFRDVLAWFRERSIPLVVAYLPNSPRTSRRWREVEPRAHAAIVAACGAAGVPFIDFDLEVSDDDFVDETHMGLPLARRLSARLAAGIAALGPPAGRTDRWAHHGP